MRVGQLGRHEEPELLVVLHCRIAQADPQSGRTLLVVHTDGFVRHVERECDSVFVSTDSLSKLRQGFPHPFGPQSPQTNIRNYRD